MKKEYNFKQGIRGKFFREKKVQKTLRLDADVLRFYQALAEKEGVPYQTLINLTLRKFAGERGTLIINAKK
ncbi:MAG: BrnA antitoxin family protein [Deltaproteobacteria bacterium]|nr:BrnA antitoxin family protein [Deltaproteobacteria bacterium]